VIDKNDSNVGKIRKQIQRKNGATSLKETQRQFTRAK